MKTLNAIYKTRKLCQSIKMNILSVSFKTKYLQINFLIIVIFNIQTILEHKLISWSQSTILCKCECIIG